jgi:hypothetical protein
MTNTIAERWRLSLPGNLGSSMWTVDKAGAINLVCSGQDFILEISTEATPLMLEEGPTPPPEPPGPHP